MKHLMTTAAIAALSIAAYADKAVDLIKRYEDFRPSVYICQAGVKAIGYGFTSADMIVKGYVSREDADRELTRLCEEIRQKLRRELQDVRLTEAEEAALISLIYNVGWRRYRASTIHRKIRQGIRGSEVAEEIRKWVYVTKDGRKVKSKGLQKRRLSEALIFEQ